MDFQILLPEFKQYCIRERGLRPKSYQTIIQHVSQCLTFLEKKQIQTIHVIEIRQYLYQQAEQKAWSAKTFRNHLQSLNSFYNWALKKHYVHKNPAKTIEKPKLPKPLPRYLTQEQVSRVLHHTKTIKWSSSFMAIRNYSIIATFLKTGLRLSELLELQLDDLDLKGLTLKIRKAKGQKMRILPIHPELNTILQTYLLCLYKQKHTPIWLFPSIQKDKPLRPKTIQAICQKISIQASVKFTPHMLRHTFGRQCTDQNLPFFKLKQLMGHSSVVTTERYASISTQGLKDSFYQINFS